MSGYASNIYYIDNGQVYSSEEEAAGKIGKIIGVIAAIAIPFAAPAIFGAIAGSGVLGAGLAAAASAGTMGTLTSVLGSAAVGAIANAGVAYASGARGGDVWRAAGLGALSGGIGGYANVTSAAASAANGAGATAPGVNAVGGTGPVVLAPTAGSGTNIAIGATTGVPTVSTTVMNGIRQAFNGVQGLDLNRISAAITNAAVNGQSMGRLDGLVAQQRAELDALRASDRAVYDQQINAAQQMLADADRMDPNWMARVRMADVAGMEANQFRQAMRNIATRQGGSLDSGQRKAYERGSALHTARSKALVYNRGYIEGQGAQNQLRSQAAGLLGPDASGFRHWQADTELEAGRERAKQESDQSTWGGFSDAIFGPRHAPATSPDPSTEEDDNQQTGIFTWGRD